MHTIKTLTIAAIKMFVRNKQSAFFSLFMPLMIMTIFGFIGFDSVPKTNLGLVIDSPNLGTEQFVEQLNNIETFEISIQTMSLDTGKNDVRYIITSDEVRIEAAGIINIGDEENFK